MDEPIEPPPGFPVIAAAFEGSLVLVALGLGWLVGHRPLETFALTWSAAGWGCAAAVQLLLLLGLGVRLSWQPVTRLVEVVDDLIVPLFGHSRVSEMAVIALLAGLGEEMLFRGVVQPAIAAWIGGSLGLWIGLLAAALLFALAHLITPTYGVFAGLIGLYLGAVWILSGNLLVPVTAHAVYDFLALVYLVRVRPAGAGSPNKID